MPRLTLLATLDLESEGSFQLLLNKLSDLPRHLGAREIDVLPPIMLVTDLVRYLREQQQQPQLTIALQEQVSQKRGDSRLLFQLNREAQAEAVQLPAALEQLLDEHRPDDGEPSSWAVALPLQQSLEPARLEALIAALNTRSREQLMSELQQEKQKARDVLYKIFPGSIVEQLEEGATAIYNYYPSTTVLFSDMVGFTNMSKNMDARELVTFIDDVFQRIDRLCERHGVEKIKTIGDAYMAAAGVPNGCDDHAERVANLAMDIQELHRDLASADGASQLNARIGIHSGPVVGGVIGLTKFTFDLWGDTVNVASRMESTGIPGEIQVSIATRNLLPARYITHIRGHVAMKGHDSIETFLLRGR